MVENASTSATVTAAEAASIGEVDTTSDVIAGWLGGAAGILISNPLEVLKVRLQTARESPSSSSPSSTRVGRSNPRPDLSTLWRSEGVRFLYAGAAGPIIGLAFIDAAFFGLYGRAMNRFNQDRQDPTSLGKVFVAGAAAGGICAMLETPIEVVKCRAQVESGHNKKLGSFRIAGMIAKHEGLKGFYIGGLTTALHDGISSGIFFCGYFVFRRLLRGESALHTSASPPPAPRIPSTSSSAMRDIPTPPPSSTEGFIDKMEVGRILLAGGLAGALSAIIPYPFDIIKTRLQTSNFEALAPNTVPSHTSPPPLHSSTPASFLRPSTSPSTLIQQERQTIRSVARGIHADGVASYRYRYSSTLLYSFLTNYVYYPSSSIHKASTKMIDGRPAPDPRASKLALKLLGLKGFATGIKPTVVSSFIGSAVTITGFELALNWLGKSSDASGGVG